MNLTLEIISTTPAMPAERQRSFREDGGRIGREKSNDWVLPHNKVSSRHAVISYRNGVFYIEDRSRNGVFLNSTTNRLTPGRPQALQSGDVLFIEPYEIQVAITEDVSDSALQFDRDEDPFAQRQAPPPPAYVPSSIAHSDALPVEEEEFASAEGYEVDPLKLLGGSGGAPSQGRPTPPRENVNLEELERRPMRGHYQPPAIIEPPPILEPPPPASVAPSGAEMIPEDYDPVLDAIVPDSEVVAPRAAAPAPPPPVPEAPPEPEDPFGPLPPVRPEPPRIARPTPRSARVAAAAPTPKPKPIESKAPAPPPLPPQAPPAASRAEVAPVPTPAIPAAPSPADPFADIFDNAPAVELEPGPEPVAAAAPASPPPAAAPPPPASPPPPHVTAPSAAPPPVAGSPALDLAQVLAGAGLENIQVTPELAESFGRILKVVVEGVMDLLRARQQVKDELRMRQTMFRPLDNNPLKFSANVDDALHNLLVKRNPAYLKPVEAFSDAFDDLRDPLLAMLAGLRVAFEAMLIEFDPARLEEQFDRTLKKGALLSVPAKLRYWDAYRERTRELIQDMDATFRKWFGEEFVKAYEEQLERLEVERRERTP